MVGRTVLFRLDKKPQPPGEVVLTLEDVCADNDKGLPALRSVSLTVRAGEIVGVAGVAGNGQSELAEVITGLRQCTSGRVLVQGEDVTNQPALQAIQHRRLAHVPEDRTHVGTAPNLSITDNVIMKSYRQPPLGERLVAQLHGRPPNALAAEGGVRHPRAQRGDPGAPAVGRQPAARDPGARTLGQAAAADRHAAHARPGCGRD